MLVLPAGLASAKLRLAARERRGAATRALRATTLRASIVDIVEEKEEEGGLRE